MKEYCVFEPTNVAHTYKCIKCCKYKKSLRKIEDIRSYCGKSDMPLGDMVARGLSKIGITKERVQKIIKHCGCDKRQEALNNLGQQIHDTIDNMGLTNDEDTS